MRAIIEHMRSYPDYLSNGGTYQIPQDHYERIKYYLSMPESIANKMPTSTGEFSLRQWKEVHELFASGDISISDIEPSVLSYGDAQADAIVGTFDREKEKLSETDQTQRDIAYQESKPSLAEGAKVTAISAAIEGTTSFGMALVRKRKAGKKLSEFDTDDWLEVVGEAGKGTVTGGIRGLSMYSLTNYTATPAAVASAVVTASFGVAEQAHLYRTGQIDQIQFIEHSEILCVDATISALSSFAGQVLIPVPILGAVIGNTVGTLMYQIAKDKFSETEQAIIGGYLKDIEQLDAQLSDEFQAFIKALNANFEVYVDLVSRAFSPDVETALNGSMNLAKSMGVPTEEILDSKEKIAAYFVD